jgi:hypothetical protein
VIVIKGVVKLISLLLVMLFIPKLEDILTMVSSLMEVDMDMEMDKDKPAKPAKPEHHDDDNQDQSDDNPMEETSEFVCILRSQETLTLPWLLLGSRPASVQVLWK